jgi:hypothetical protein
MNDELEMEMQLEIVELGDAKEETKGLKTGPVPEENPVSRFRPID